MTQDIQFLLLGLGNGAVYAALALALVMTYRSSGVVNFATGAIALYIAYTYAYLRDGELLIPIPGFPKTIDLGGPLGLAPAMVIALLIAAGLGALLYLCVFRMLRTAPATAKAVASIAVMLVIQALLAARVGTSPVSVDAILPTDIIEIGDIRVSADRVWIAALVVVLTVLLILAFRLTRFGLATRAAAESEKGAIVAGLSPERIAYANWALSTMIAGLAGILIAPIVPLIPVSYTLFIVPALAAALVGNFSAIGPAVAAGLGIGVLQSEMTHLQASVSWMPQSGMAELIPLAMILIFLVVRGKPLPTRGAIIQNTLGAAPRPRNLLIPTIVGVVVALGFLIFTEGSIRGAVIVTFTVAIIALSQVVVTGFAGQISLAQLTLAGVAAYTMSRLTTDWGVPFPIAPVLAALAATVVGVVVGLPALRIRGLPVAVVTLSLAVFLEAFWFRNNEFNGGIDGAVVKDPSLFGLDLGIGSGSTYPNIAFGILCLIVLTLVGLGVARLRTSRLGASMLAVRANERSAAAGVNVSRTKLVAFAIGAFIAGIGGSLMAYQQTVVVPESYAAIAGIGMFALVYLAGVTCVSGGVLAGIMGAGGILFVLLDRTVNLGTYYHVITGVLLVITIIANPEGIISEVHKAANWLRARISGHRDTEAELDLTISSEADAEPGRRGVDRRSQGEVRTRTERREGRTGVGSRRPFVVHLAHRRGEPAALRPVSAFLADGTGHHRGDLPPARRPAQGARRCTLRRRAADARDRTGSRAAPQGPADRRTQHGPGAGHRRTPAADRPRRRRQHRHRSDSRGTTRATRTRCRGHRDGHAARKSGAAGQCVGAGRDARRDRERVHGGGVRVVVTLT